jgi:hypothetical protein
MVNVGENESTGSSVVYLIHVEVVDQLRGWFAREVER